MDKPNTGLRIDLGCGALKKEGTIGVDAEPLPGVDHVVDVETQPLPFANRSVEYLHSSHFLEHTLEIGRIFADISRVCADNARLELWTPYAWSNSAFILGHKTFLTEELYLHICVLFSDYWKSMLGARWVLNELQYVIEPDTLCYLNAKDISLDFALKHLQNIAKEFCAHITIRHDDSEVISPPIRRTFSTGRAEPRYEVRPDPASQFGANGPESQRGYASIDHAIGKFAAGAALPPWEN